MIITHEYVKPISEVTVDDFDFKVTFTDENGKTYTHGVLVPVTNGAVNLTKLNTSITNLIADVQRRFPDGF